MRAFLLALIVGAASAFAFQPTGLWPLMPLAFAVLCELISRDRSVWRALLTGWAFGVGQFVIGLNWIATAFTYQAAMPAWLGWIAVVLLSLYLAIYPALAAGIAWRFGRDRPLPLVLGLVGAWPVTEWLRGTMFTGFAWNPVGVTLVDTPWRHVATFIGTYGLSLLVVAAGGAIWLAVRRGWKAALGTAAALLLLLALPAPLIPDCCLRTFDVQQAPPPAPSPNPQPAAKGATATAFRIVQPNIGQEEKWRDGLVDEAFTRLATLSQGGAPPPRLLFWPEVAVPVPFGILDTNRDALPVPLPAVPRALQSVRPGDVLATGAFALIVDGNGTVVGNTNSVFALDSNGHLFGRYDKAHLVPYGEYLPMRPLLSAIGLSQLAPGQGDTSFGPGPRTIDLGLFGKMGVQVCYEIIFSGEVVDRDNRPDFIFNPSNDAWFGRWGPPQHLAQARVRAAEEGIPVIRATPTGISAIVDARGTILKSLPWRTAGVIDGDLPQPAASPTLFAKLGNVIPLALGFLLIVAAIALGARGRYRRET